MGIIAKPLGMLLQLIYTVIGNYGISLIVLTAIVRLIMAPLYVKQIKSTANMQELQPKMKEIQEKYANDQQKQNEELQKLYQEEHFNPMGGCLPMLIQFPIIMGLFTLLRNPLVYMPDEKMWFAIHESFLWINDLAQPDKWILPILAALGTFFSFSMTQQLTQADTNNNQMQSMNLIMKYFFPISILMLARAYPAGLAIYWAFGQFLQIFLNIYMNKVRREMHEKTEHAKLVARAEKELRRRKSARMKGNRY
ncbi:MAG: YidC/Oxa1 family membrane protein insertase [Mogibacterium sp.]|nr:YidC/Oxa1 family membrane protein insertase [Mogibacterium sp.]